MTTNATGKVHAATLKAWARYEAAEAENKALRAKLDEFGAVFCRAPAHRKNKYKTYVYMKEDQPAPGRRNSPARAIFVGWVWAKYKDIAFTSDVSLLEQENSDMRYALRVCFDFVYTTTNT